MEQELAQLKREVAELREWRAEAERVWQHEQQLARRRWRSALALGTLGLLAGLAGALARPGLAAGAPVQAVGLKVRAPFAVLDNRGRTVFQVTAVGAARQLSFLDQNGQPVILARDRPSGRGLDVRDARGKLVIGMGTLPAAAGQIRGLDVFDAAEKPIIALEVGTTPVPRGMHVNLPAQKNVANLFADDSGGRLRLTNSVGATTFSAP